MAFPSKILLMTLEYPPQIGGIGRYYQRVAQEWNQGIEVLSRNFFWRLWPHWLPSLWRIARLVKRKKIEMIWVGQVLPLGYVAFWLKKRKRVPFLVFIHGLDILLPQKSFWKKMWLKKILAAADLIVANSEFTRGELLKLGISTEKTVVIYPCSFFDPLEDSAIVGADEKIILSVGRLVKRKGFDKVIEALPRLLERVPDVQYVIIGSGPEAADLKFQIARLDLENKVFILENLSDEKLMDWYRRCAVFVIPCRQIGPDVEGFGMVFLEAAGFGKPVIAGRSGGAPEAVRDGYGGYVIDPESREELHQTLLKFLSDKEFAARAGEYGRKWVNRNFQWAREAAKLKKRCQDL